MQRNYDAIISQIEKRFGVKSTRKFENAVGRALDLLESNPEIDVLKEGNKGIRALTVNRLTQIFYVVQSERIFVLDIFDFRKDPMKQPK